MMEFNSKLKNALNSSNDSSKVAFSHSVVRVKSSNKRIQASGPYLFYVEITYYLRD